MREGAYGDVAAFEAPLLLNKNKYLLPKLLQVVLMKLLPPPHMHTHKYNLSFNLKKVIEEKNYGKEEKVLLCVELYPKGDR